MLIDDVLSMVKPRHQDAEWLLDQLKKAKVIKAHNVADYVAETWDEDKWNILRDHPNVAPVFDNLWIEWVHPSTTFQNDSDNPLARRARVGISLISFNLSRPIEEAPYVFQAAPPLTETFPAAKWFTVGSFIWELGPGKYRCPPAYIWAVGEDGQPIFRNGDETLIIPHPLFPDQRPMNDGDRDVGAFHFFHLSAPFLALSLMHCKNVQIEKSAPISERLPRARQRRGKLPLVRWHTLVIDSSIGGGSKHHNGIGSIPISLHICRGHFKTFSDRGLFGKYRGTFWWSHHTRGSADAGIVNKDYDVQMDPAQPVFAGGTHAA